MHFEVPKAKSFKEFGGEYLMIVISIITALALEHAVQTIHHRHVAHEASQKIDSEIRANIDEIGRTLAHNERKVRELNVVKEELLAGIRNKVDDAVLMARFTKEGDTLNLSIMGPSLRREAWEVAVANQSVTWMPPAALEAYSTVYAAMRDLQSPGNINFLDGPRWLDAGSNVQMGLSNPREVFRMLNQMMGAYGSLDSNLKGLQRQLSAAASARASAH